MDGGIAERNMESHEIGPVFRLKNWPFFRCDYWNRGDVTEVERKREWNTEAKISRGRYEPVVMESEM